MICRHSSGDPACGSTAGGWRAAENAREHERNARESEQRKTKAANERVAELERRLAALSPDPTAYDLEDIRVVGSCVVVKVSFPNCSSCSYEGRKVLVYENTDALAVARWRKLDPHFRESGKNKDPKTAPPPAARFPASPEGWERAVEWAKTISGKKELGR